jgi:hypothetical protein
MSAGNFSFYEFVRDWPEFIVAMDQLETRIRREGAAAAADRLLKAVVVFNRELGELADRAAIKATEMLRESERRTRVRPDTQGGGGPRLETSLVATPVAPDILPGSIGVSDEDLLDADVPWWITNEEGSTTLVDEKRVLYGTFEPGGAAPDITQSRAHPLFQPGYGPGTGSGLIKNPIPARRFILKAIPEINAMWQSDFRQIKTRMDNELTQVLAMAQVERGRA